MSKFTNADAHTNLLAQKLAAVPARQLAALEQAINGCRAYAVALMSWMSDLVRWESARRARREMVAALPQLTAHVADLDPGKAVLTLSIMTTLFQSSATTGVADFQPTIDLLDAIRQTLAAYGAPDNRPLH